MMKQRGTDEAGREGVRKGLPIPLTRGPAGAMVPPPSSWRGGGGAWHSCIPLPVIKGHGSEFPSWRGRGEKSCVSGGAHIHYLRGVGASWGLHTSHYSEEKRM